MLCLLVSLTNFPLFNENLGTFLRLVLSIFFMRTFVWSFENFLCFKRNIKKDKILCEFYFLGDDTINDVVIVGADEGSC